MAIHSSDARRQLTDFHIGTLVGSLETKEEVNEDASRPFLDEKRWKKATLVSTKDVSSDTKMFRFALQRNDQEFGLPVGQHVYVRLRRKPTNPGESEGELVQRAYTPVSRPEDKGFLDLLVKYAAFYYTLHALGFSLTRFDPSQDIPSEYSIPQRRSYDVGFCGACSG
jgi:nitrate reductase (NAD(P)H)